MTFSDSLIPVAAAASLDDCWNRIGVRGRGDCPELQRHIHCRNCPVYAAAADARLDIALPEGYAETWARHYAKVKETAPEGLESAVLFRLGAEWFLLPSSAVDEIAALRPIHSLPHRRDAIVLGLVNIRGELRVCVSLHELLGLTPAKPSETGDSHGGHPRLLVLRREHDRLVVPADDVHGLHRFARSELSDPPSAILRSGMVFTQAILAWNGRRVGLLDEARLFSQLERSLS